MHSTIILQKCIFLAGIFLCISLSSKGQLLIETSKSFKKEFKVSKADKQVSAQLYFSNDTIIIAINDSVQDTCYLLKAIAEKYITKENSYESYLCTNYRTNEKMIIGFKIGTQEGVVTEINETSSFILILYLYKNQRPNLKLSGTIEFNTENKGQAIAQCPW